MEHPSEELLTTYTIEPALVPERAELEAHLRDCADCAARLADIRAFEAMMADEAVWETDEPEPPPVLRETAARKRREDEDAAILLKPWLEASPEEFVYAGDLASSPKFHTAGVVRRLASAADQTSYSNPRHALNIAETAILIGGALSRLRYSAEELAGVNGIAWKQRANALRHLGRFAEAREALDRAQHYFERLLRPELDLASLTFIRATTYTAQQDYDLAERYAAESTTTFAHLGQTELYFGSRLLQGYIALEKRDLIRAQEMFEPVLAYGEARGDAKWVARGALAVGHSALERGDLTTATRLFHISLLHYQGLGITSDEIRCRWALALVVRRGGRPRMAVSRFRAVRDEFVTLGAVTDAALVTLDLMETFLELGSAREVQRTAGEVVRIFREHGMLTGAMTAADYLKRAAAMQSVTPGIIDYVRKYIRRVEAEPDFAFAVPVEL